MKSILIVGGGSAGWMAAAYLNKVLRINGTEQPIPITVVESEAIGAIGVGEATVPTMRAFLATVGVPEWQMLRETQGTFKHGIAFNGWNEPDAQGRQAHYFHPFETPTSINGYAAGVHWLNLRDRGMRQPDYADAVSVQPLMARERRSTKPQQAKPYESPLPYAYHLDAAKYGELLRNVATSRGVKHISDKVTQVHRLENGDISHVSTENHGDLSADFFIDASGFRAILLGAALGEPFEDWTQYLLCDRAVACQIPHTDKNLKLRPYTTSTAKEAGWIWEIDLYTRRGNGYVYSSRHTNKDRAEEVLRDHLGASAEGHTARHLQMMIGHRKNMWAGNCLALGLSAGFLEPLESTGIYLVEMALSFFLDHLPHEVSAPLMRKRFNVKMQNLYVELRDFLQLHYVFSNLETSEFWRDYRHEVKVPESLQAKLEIWKHKLPSFSDLDGQTALFGPANYAYILAGFDKLPRNSNLTQYVSAQSSRAALGVIEQAKGNFLKGLPDHTEYLKKLRSAA